MPDSRKHIFTNNATSRLARNIADTDTAIELVPGGSDTFPFPSLGEIFKITVENVLTGAREIMNVVEVYGDSFIVERAVEDTDVRAVALNFDADVNTIVSHRVTADTLASVIANSGGGMTLTPHADSYEFTADDANTGHANPNGNGNNSYFIPGHSTINFPLGTFFTVFNRDDPGTVTVTVEEDGLVGAADASTGTVVTINARGMATFCKTFIDEWTVVGSNISTVG